MDEHDPILTY